jgi:hypothetical protein
VHGVAYEAVSASGADSGHPSNHPVGVDHHWAAAAAGHAVCPVRIRHLILNLRKTSALEFGADSNKDQDYCDREAEFPAAVRMGHLVRSECGLDDGNLILVVAAASDLTLGTGTSNDWDDWAGQSHHQDHPVVGE